MSHRTTGINRVRLFAVCLAVLAAWMQFVAPVAMANAPVDADPFSIICSQQAMESRATDTKDGSAPVHHATHHPCCTLCHAQLGALTPDDRPVFTTFDYPLASPLRWQPVALPPMVGPGPRQHPPRGPPSLV